MRSLKSKFVTPLFVGAWKLSPAITPCTVIVLTLLTGCGSLTKHSLGPDPLVTAACPELTPLSDGSFGGTTNKLVEVAGQYRECRTAALAGKKK